MSRDLFRQGGPYNIRRTGPHQHTFQIPIQSDEHGRIARTCPHDACSPGYFKVRLGTGITEGEPEMHCPYCRVRREPSEFMTSEQLRYGKDVMMREAHKGIQDMMKDALGIGPSGRRKFGGGMFSMELSYKPGQPPMVRNPFEEDVQRDVICPHCGLDHAVFGLATWCPDCGRDIFMTHVEAEYGVVRTMLGDVERRRKELGPRIGARDLENCLEDTVSIFEAVLKAMLTRHLRSAGQSEEEIDKLFKERFGNRLQNPERAAEIIQNRMNQSLFENIAATDIQFLKNTFEKRHPITHNMGVMDRKYLERVMEAERAGKDILVTSAEIESAIAISLGLLTSLHSRVFGDSTPGTEEQSTQE